MNPRLRNFLGAAAAVVVAFLLGWKVAEGELAWPSLAATVILAVILVRLIRISLDAILVGFLLVGYIIGNRGFAQLLLPVAGVPLFPAEAVLLLALAWRLVRWGFARRLPYRRDALNFAVLAWLVVGTARVAFDIPHYGLTAVRDYAMIYYALFFFLSQDMADDAPVRGYLRSCLLFASVALVPIYILFDLFPDLFLQQLTVMRVPLVYYKGDIARTSLMAGSILIFHWARGVHRYWAWPLSAVLFVYVAAADNRAAILGGAIACVLMLLARRWRYPALQGATGALGLVVVMVLALVFNNDWAEKKLDGLSDRFTSMVDFTGSGSYASEEASYKGGNNRYRAVWWRNVAVETWTTNPVFGLGFGADLAQGFVQEYYPDSTEEFNVRSPHSIAVSAFGRMGLVGLAAWLAVCGALLARTWRALRRSDDPVLWSLWLMAWTILVSASLGVVLEGPMGAVVFWTLLGLANAHPLPAPAVEAAGTPITAEPTAADPA